MEEERQQGMGGGKRCEKRQEKGLKGQENEWKSALAGVVNGNILSKVAET